jgi:hypothetical protein
VLDGGGDGTIYEPKIIDLLKYNIIGFAVSLKTK